MFEVGELVQCIDVMALPGWPPPTELRKGAIYTISACYRAKDRRLVVRLCEVKPRNRWDSFSAHRFRPLPSSQIALVNSMLVTEPTKKPVWEKETSNVR